MKPAIEQKILCHKQSKHRQVRSMSNSFSVAPMINPDQTNYNVIQGRNLNIPCVARGDPTPTIAWYHHGKNMGNGRPDGSYEIIRAKEENKGDWKCVATNPVGSAERDVRVQVHSKFVSCINQLLIKET